MNNIQHSILQDLPSLKSPITVFWELSDLCNLSCLHCYTNSNKKGSINKKEKLVSILYQLIDEDILSIGFGGGEPLMLPYIFDLIDIAESNNVKTSISTNGTLVNHKNVLKLRKANLSIAQISIDGPEHVHEFIRGKNTFMPAIKGFRMFKEFGIETRAAMTITNLNYKFIKKTADICMEAGADRFVVFRYVPEGRKSDNLVISKDILKEITMVLLDIEKNYPSTIIGFEDLIFFPHLLDINKTPKHRCNAGVDVLNILANGDITPCPHSRQIVIGNIFNSTLKIIWKNWLKKVNKFHSTPKLCQDINCLFIKSCNGGCRGSGMNNKLVADIDPYCWMINT